MAVLDEATLKAAKTRRDLRWANLASALASRSREAGVEGVPFSKVSAIVRRAWAEGLLAAHDGNESQAAEEGGIHRNTLHRMNHGE